MRKREVIAGLRRLAYAEERASLKQRLSQFSVLDASGIRRVLRRTLIHLSMLEKAGEHLLPKHQRQNENGYFFIETTRFRLVVYYSNCVVHHGVSFWSPVRVAAWNRVYKDDMNIAFYASSVRQAVEQLQTFEKAGTYARKPIES